jgi:dephospho-CoA kinase
LLIVDDNGEIKPVTKDYLSESTYNIYKYKNNEGIGKYKSIIENVIFSKSDYTQNLDQWKAGTFNNILFITGHSGSGKTTTSKELETKHKAIRIELDLFEHKQNVMNSKYKTKGDEYIYNYVTKVNPGLKSIDFNKYSNDKFHNEFVKFFDWLIKELNKDKENLFIIEGVQLFTHVDMKNIKDKPLIVKGTSVISSLIARQKRDSDNSDWRTDLIKYFPKFFKWYLEKEKQLGKFINNIKESYDSSFFYEYLTDKKLLSEDQLEFDPDFEEVLDIRKVINCISESINESITNENISLSVVNRKLILEINNITNIFKNIIIEEDTDGYFARNINNSRRTKSYENIIDIPEEALTFINKL